jgi:hypothetical protein
MWNVFLLLLLLQLLFFFSSRISTVKASVSYDHKAVIINGQRRILISGSIHYPRSTPEVPLIPMWLIHGFFFLLFLPDFTFHVFE